MKKFWKWLRVTVVYNTVNARSAAELHLKMVKMVNSMFCIFHHN